jgi:CO/xanthine dehydrogenase FAD-binding subunit
MKPAPFAYMAPASVEEAVQALAAYGEDAKLLAGGQSLMPLLNMRLSIPEVIVDISGLAELDYVRLQDDTICIGALTRQAILEQHPLIQDEVPFLRHAVQLIGHPPIRYAGTVGGSLAHADPAAELPAAMCALQAEFTLRGAAGERRVHADDFFLGYLTVDIQPHEMLVEARFPLPHHTVWGMQEYTRRMGDFALAGACLVVQLDDARRCGLGRVVLFGVADRPLRVPAAEAYLSGRELSAALADHFAAVAVEGLECEGDIHASASYRHHLAGVMAKRALVDAVAQAEGRRNGTQA